MKIRNPVLEAEIPTRGGGKYRELWAAAIKLGAGEVLPVEFPNNAEAQTFSQGYQHPAKRRGLKLVLRSNVVYITQRNGGS